MNKKLRHPQYSTKGLVANYKLWAGLTSTAAVHDYAGGFTGTPTGTDIAPAYPGFKFNGTNDYIDIGTGPTAVSTVAMWAKPDDVAGIDSLIDLNDTDLLVINTGILAKAGFAGGSAVLYVDGLAATAVTANWHLLAITDTVAKNADNLDIGNVAGGWMAGRIGETWLYDRVLSPADIKSLYELTKWRYPNN